MNERLKEDVSGLFDGECDELSMARVLSSIEENTVRSQISNYSVIQSVLRSEDVDPAVFSMDISNQVRNQIQSGIGREVASELSSQSDNSNMAAKRTWLKPALGFAMAASMAFVMVFNFDSTQSDAIHQVAELRDAELLSGDEASDHEMNEAFAQQATQTQPVNEHQDLDVALASHVSLAEERLNDPFQAAVAVDQELRKRENALLEAQQENIELQQHLREYLISHARQNVSAPVNSALPIARASHTEY
ncbi:MAG: RseA family anti-sigma factor [Pseudomonadota bacterium]